MFYKFFLCCTIFLLAGCINQTRQESLTIAGSTTILPISEMWANDFTKKTGILVNVQGGGSTNGIKLVNKQQVDLGASSRDLNKSEKKDLKLIEIGKDALSVIVNTTNPVTNITLEALRDIYDGKITNWQDLGGDDAKIHVITRESGSGSRETFEKLVMCYAKPCKDMALNSVVLNSNAEIKRSVELIKYSIGYISFGFVDSNIQPISINNAVLSLENIYNGSYPLARGLYYIKHKSSNNNKILNTYIKYIFSKDAQSVLLDKGFVPVRNLNL